MRSFLKNIYFWCLQMTHGMEITFSFYELKILDISLHLTIEDAYANKLFITSY